MTERETQKPFVRLSSRYADVVALESGDTSNLDVVFCQRSDPSALFEQHNGGRHALVIGANGFIGAHLIKRLVSDEAIGKVYGLARRRGRHSAENRVFSALEKWGLTLTPDEVAKLEVIEGSPSGLRESLGEGVWLTLTIEVDLVYQAASSTDYEASYLKLRKLWVLGLLSVMALCHTGRPKHFTWLGSTLSQLYQTPADFKRTDSWWYSGYAQMKWVNEQLLRKGMAKGLSATICQTPYVLGSTTEARDPGLHYSFWRVVQAFEMLKVVRSGEGVNFVPVDVLCEALVDNSLSAKPLNLIRPSNPEPWDTQILADLMGCELASWGEFRRRLMIHLPAVGASVVPPDLAEVVDRTNLPAIYPPGFKTSRFPEVSALMARYLAQLGLRQHGESVRPDVVPPALLQSSRANQPKSIGLGGRS